MEGKTHRLRFLVKIWVVFGLIGVAGFGFGVAGKLIWVTGGGIGDAGMGFVVTGMGIGVAGRRIGVTGMGIVVTGRRIVVTGGRIVVTGMESRRFWKGVVFLHVIVWGWDVYKWIIIYERWYPT